MQTSTHWHRGSKDTARVSACDERGEYDGDCAILIVFTKPLMRARVSDMASVKAAMDGRENRHQRLIGSSIAQVHGRVPATINNKVA